MILSDSDGRLLDEHVHAGIECIPRSTEMQRMGKENRNTVDIADVEHPAVMDRIG